MEPSSRSGPASRVDSGPGGAASGDGPPEAVAWMEAALARDGYRLTRARHTILGTLTALDHPFTATELQEAVSREEPGIGRASVYRTLLLLEELGYVEKLHQPGSEHYTLCLKTRHHHHLTCTRCGRSEALALGDDLGVLATLNAAARDLGYLPRTHVLAVYGICPACQAEEADPSPPASPTIRGAPGHSPDSRHPIGQRFQRSRTAASPGRLSAKDVPHPPGPSASARSHRERPS